jgi:solute:Na+ symporter, SSS family
MAIMCFAARKVTAFKRTVVLYPLAIMAIWLPCIFLGVIGTQLEPGLKNPDGILLHLLTDHAPVWLAGILGAGIISAVMGSDTHQVLAVSTMFTKDVFAHYGGTAKYGERGSVVFARGFIVCVTGLAYLIALITPESIFELAVRFAFSGFAAMAPVMIAALFWKRSTKYGALASTLWVAAWLLLTWYLQRLSDGIAPKPGQPVALIFPALGHLFERSTANVTVFGFLPVVPMVLGSAAFMVLVSLMTNPPSKETIDKYFSAERAEDGMSGPRLEKVAAQTGGSSRL